MINARLEVELLNKNIFKTQFYFYFNKFLSHSYDWPTLALSKNRHQRKINLGNWVKINLKQDFTSLLKCRK